MRHPNSGTLPVNRRVMHTLVEILPRIRSLGRREAVRFTDGIRTRVWSYADLHERIAAFAALLKARGTRPGDRLVLWAENGPEWVAAFWGSIVRGVVVVPVDAQSSHARVRRIREEAAARLLVHDSDRRLDEPGVDCLPIDGVPDLPSASDAVFENVGEDDVVEILYTSGTTAAPRGVVHRHRNICANLTPIAREIDRYARWARPFQPIRFLNAVPLSHMLGQSMGLFIPPLLGGAAVFMRERRPGALVRAVRAERVSVLVCVPRILAGLRAEIERRHPATASPAGRVPGVARRWWRHRRAHADLGWKFWAFVVGGARLDPDLEAYWSRIGLLVVQGYGLTETSPVVAVNHPFHARRGTLGTRIGNQEVRLAADGEILVRGPSVVQEYVGGAGRTTPVTDADGWFHTGDIGALDAENHLVFRGRKKDVIVTADGLNIHPEDVEGVLDMHPDVLDSAVVAVAGPHGERPHAVMILKRGADPESVIEDANRKLEPSQRLRDWSIWPGESLPRTASTGKLQRHRVRAALGPDGADPAPSAAPADTLIDLVSGATGRERGRLRPDRHLEFDLGLSSLERVELLAAIEERYGIEMDEAAFAGLETIGDIDARIQEHRSGPSNVEPATARVAAPRWARNRVVRAVGRWIVALVVAPVLALFARVELRGAGRLRELERPVLFAATHASHVDVPVILKALPPPWRRRIAPAVLQEYFFPPGTGGARRTLAYLLTCGVFNAFPLPQRMGQIRDSLRYAGELVDAGYCPLVFPEGRRTEDGRIQAFRPGVGFMAARLDLPVVPLRLHGTFELFPKGARWPRTGAVIVQVGIATRPREGESYDGFAHRLEQSMRAMSPTRPGKADGEGGPQKRRP